MRRFIYASCLGVALLACETTTLNGDSARGMSPFDSSSSREDALDIAPPVTNLEFFASSLGCRTDEIEFEFKSPEAKPKFVEIRCRGSAEPLTKCTADVASCENLEGSRQPSWGLSEDDRGGRGAEAQPSARRSARPGPEKEPETNTAAVSPPGAENPSASAPAIGDVPQDPVANSPEDNARLGVDSGSAAGRSTAAESTIAIDENSAAPQIQSDHAAGTENPSASAPAIGDVPQDPVANSPEDNARLGVDSGGAAGRSTAAESTIAIDENSAAPQIQSDHAAGTENPSASAPAIGDVPQDPVANSPEDNARLGVDSGGAAGRSTAAESTIAIDENSAAPQIQSDHAAVEDPTLRKNRSERHVASESTLGKVETVTQDPGKVRGEVPTQPPERPEDEDSPFLGDWLLDDWGDGNDRDHSNRQ